MRLSLPTSSTILQWRIRVNEPFVNEHPLLDYIDAESVRRTLLSPDSGFVEKIYRNDGAVSSGESIAEMIPCKHDVAFGGLCAECGKDISGLKITSINHGHRQISVSQREAQRIGNEKATALVKAKKLAFVLDLDHTLIHATKEEHVRKRPLVDGREIFEFTLPGSPDIYFVKLRPGLKEFLEEANRLCELHIYTMGTRPYAVKIAQILQSITRSSTPLFLDNHIVSRDDNPDLNSKNLTWLFPYDDSMVLIIDDREDVWQTKTGQTSPNLIRVEPYHFFDTRREMNALPKDPLTVHLPAHLHPHAHPKASNGPHRPEKVISSESKEEEKIEALQSDNNDHQETKTTENNDDKKEKIPEAEMETENTNKEDLNHPKEGQDKEEETKEEDLMKEIEEEAIEEEPIEEIRVERDATLGHVMEVIRRVHHTFYTTKLQAQKDVKVLLSDRRRSVLQGCVLLFSGLIPLKLDPKLDPLWRMAEAFGAKCTLKFSPDVTHVVAAKAGTEKVTQALKTENVFLINANWLYESIRQWSRMPEVDYSLDGLPVKYQPTDAPLTKKQKSDAEESEEEDFAKMLEDELLN